MYVDGHGAEGITFRHAIVLSEEITQLEETASRIRTVVDASMQIHDPGDVVRFLPHGTPRAVQNGPPPSNRVVGFLHNPIALAFNWGVTIYTLTFPTTLYDVVKDISAILHHL